MHIESYPYLLLWLEITDTTDTRSPYVYYRSRSRQVTLKNMSYDYAAWLISYAVGCLGVGDFEALTWRQVGSFLYDLTKKIVKEAIYTIYHQARESGYLLDIHDDKLVPLNGQLYSYVEILSDPPFFLSIPYHMIDVDPNFSFQGCNAGFESPMPFDWSALAYILLSDNFTEKVAGREKFDYLYQHDREKSLLKK